MDVAYYFASLLATPPRAGGDGTAFSRAVDMSDPFNLLQAVNYMFVDQSTVSCRHVRLAPGRLRDEYGIRRIGKGTACERILVRRTYSGTDRGLEKRASLCRARN